MYINKLSLRNFKCFEEADIYFSKLTLLTGPNSSGKSTVIYGLLWPFQSDSFPFYFSPNGKYVNMGDYREIVFNRVNKRRIGVDIFSTEENIKQKYSLITEWVYDKHNKMPKLYYLKAAAKFAEIEVSSVSSSEKYRLKFKYDPKYIKRRRDESIKAFTPLFEYLQKLKEEGPPKKIKKKRKKRRFSLLNQYSIRGRTIKSLEQLVLEFPFIPAFPDFMSRMDRKVNFISSFRLQPERTYYQRSGSAEKVGKYGENFIDQIIEWEKRKSKNFKELNSILKNLKLLNSLKSKQLPGGRFELRAKVQIGGIWSLLTDVGFGISQFLPIVVADLQLPSNSTLFLAQPEIHLHPSVQAALGDYFVNQVIKKEKRYIVETHSEYLLNRIRLAIVKGRLKPEDVSVYYFENSTGGTKKYPILFTKDGKIEGAPKSFFETYMMDLTDIALNS